MTRGTRSKSNYFPIISLLALSVGMPAMAQSAPQAPPPATEAKKQSDRDVVVVTANKREESVQDIAVAVTAISSQTRDQIGLTTVQDYTNFAPGLSYSTANDRLGMRGVTRTSNNFGIRSGISNYVDGVYFSSAIPASREPIFIDRVEVVRGPQGTLYGRDSIGGALNVISKRPTSTFEAQVNVGAGTYGTKKLEGRVAGPITDWLRFSLAGQTSAQDKGYLTNYSGLATEGGRRSDSYFEGQLAANFGDNLDMWLRVGSLKWNNRYGAPGARTAGSDNADYDTRFLPPGAIVPNAFFGFSGSSVVNNVLQTGTQRTNPGVTDTRGFNTDFSNFAHLDPTTEVAFETVYHADTFDIKYLGGYVWYHYNLQQDNDGSPVSQYGLISQYAPTGRPINNQRISDYNENRAWFSNEINIVSTGDGPLSWIVGAYQYQENYTQPIYVSSTGSVGGFIQKLSDVQSFIFNNPQPDLPDFTGRNSSSGSQVGGDLYFHTNNQGLNNAYGAFVQTDYKFNDQWKLTAGLRWSKDSLRGREYARLITEYATEAALEAGLAPFAGLVGGQANLNALIQPRIDVTATLGGPDPTTITPTNPCGLAGKGIINTNVTAANGAAGCGGPNDRSRYGIYFDALTGNAYRDLHAGWHEVTGIIGLDWTPDTDTLVYAKYNRGYKPGGLGAAETFGLLLATPFTDKELVNATELGLKREWRDLNLTTNVVAFYYDYQGYQVSNQVIPADDGGPVRPQPYTAYVNLPKTETTGIEIETTWRPIDDLRILFNYGFTNPEIKDVPFPLTHSLDPYALDPAAQPLGAKAGAAGCTTGVSTCGLQGQTLKGNILPGSPKNKIAINGLYTTNFADGAKIDWSLSYFWQDIAYSSIFNRPYTEIPAWDQWDGRASWTSADRRFTLIGFVKNIFDTDQFDSRGSGLRQSSGAGATNVVAPQPCGSSPATTISHATNPLGSLAQACYATGVTYRPPRTAGIELQVRF